MKEYELVTVEEGYQQLKVTEGEKTWTVELYSTSPRLQEYLRYTAWVEAGNNPEDFWSQSEDFLDTSVSEVTEPKEEKEETPQEGEG
jgi:hypothetical protein